MTLLLEMDVLRTCWESMEALTDSSAKRVLMFLESKLIEERNKVGTAVARACASANAQGHGQALQQSQSVLYREITL